MIWIRYVGELLHLQVKIVNFLEDGDGDVKCKNKEFKKRHPYKRKWNQSPGGGRRSVSYAFKHRKEGLAVKSVKEVLKNGNELELDRNCKDLVEEVKAKATIREKRNVEPIDITLEEVESGDFSLEMLDRILDGFDEKKH